ncbi:glycoside hydrolase family 24 protein [Cercospora zeae-maydis SCOH1-5]|uniref:Glycoside hydrolase family 24 protein n=1 Tax=Cercospora zeae-maydis SCOH1-5 TaxID=717836 RepID=A0A6A6FNA6_9PEZI|nr:glycoside hydrolase family 24 protein [Cercospora zeae-maydis SCOH1-5]
MFSKISFLSSALLLASTASAQYQYGTCTANGQNGVCISTSECGGTSTAGACPGPSNIQCCTYGRCTRNGVSGTCESASTCTGSRFSGLCPGSSDIQCCIRSGGGSGGGGQCPPSVQSNIIDFIKSFEGFEGSPYQDVAGFWTVGYGHLCSQSTRCQELGYSYPISEAQGEQLLARDVRQFEVCLGNAVSGVRLNANQYGALVSWSFNVGCGNMQSSTLVRRLNAGEDPNTVAAQELPKWNKAGGETVPGLTRRRAEEVQLFQTATSTGALPC